MPKMSPIDPDSEKNRPRTTREWSDAPPDAGAMRLTAAERERRAGLRLFLDLERALVRDISDLGDREDRMELEEIEAGLAGGNPRTRRLACRLLRARIDRLERRRQGALDRATRLLAERIRSAPAGAEIVGGPSAAQRVPSSSPTSSSGGGGAGQPGPDDGSAAGGPTADELRRLREIAYSSQQQEPGAAPAAAQAGPGRGRIGRARK